MTHTTPRTVNTSTALHVTLWIVRLVVGLLFIFSGLIKANDPQGLANKMDEFFEVWHWHISHEISLTLSILMIGFEIIAGVAVLLGVAFRTFSFLLLLLTLFFTFLTAYVFYYDVILHAPKIKDCGCFGDCIKISNSETFYKDIVLTILVLILVVFRKHVRPLFSKYPSTALMVLTAFFAFGIQWWVLEHLPFYDCMPYKKGANLWQASQPKTGPGIYATEYETVMQYKNKQTGEVVDVPADKLGDYEYVWGDEETYEYLDRTDKLVREGNDMPDIKDFFLTDADGNDYTESVLKQPGYSFLLFVQNPAKARWDNMDELREIFVTAQQHNMPTYVLTSGTRDATAAWRQKANLTGAEFLVVDGVASKTAMRTNPGLMVLKDGVVVGKYSFRDYPDLEVNGGAVLLK